MQAFLGVLIWLVASMGWCTTVDDSTVSMTIGGSLQYIRDETGDQTFPHIEALPDTAWNALDKTSANFGFDVMPYWFRGQINNQSSLPRSLLLEIPNPLLDHVDVYIVQLDVTQHISMGDSLPFSARPINHYNYVIPLELTANGAATIYLRVQTESSMQVPLRLWDRAQFFELQQPALMGQGLYFGVMLVMVIYNFFIFLAVRHRSYIYYTGYVLGMAVFISALQGIGFQYLWPAWPELNPHILAFSAMFFVYCAIGFMISLLQLQTTCPHHFKVFRLLQTFSILFLIAALFLPNRITIQPVVIICLLTAIGGLTAGIVTLAKGVRAARYYVMAYTWLLLACFIVALGKFGLISPNWLTQYAIEICSVFEVVMLSFALADRINVERQQKFVAQRQALENEKLARVEQERYLQLRYSAQLEELKAQQALLEAKAESRAKSEFLATMSHEIRTPMNGVLGMTELLQDTHLDSQQKQYLDVIDRSGKALLNIINDILDYSKITAGKMQLELIACDLEALCNECITLFAVIADRKQLTLQCQLAPDVPRNIFTDPTRLRQILLNLLGNAFKFTHHGGVQLRVENVSPPQHASQQLLLKFVVQDTGIGIAPDARSKLFQPFTQADSTTTREYGGTGLGLSIAQRLVELMGGNIDVTSHVDAGSTFWFTLPCTPASAESPEMARSVSPALPLTNKKVLVVEDNAVNQLVIANMLGKLGVQFDFANNGAIAVQRFEQHHDQYHMILMDCEMPVMDGYQAAQQIRQLESQNTWPRTPIIALTAHVLREHRQRTQAVGMDAHIGKPLNLKALTETLTRFIQPTWLANQDSHPN